MNAGIRRIWGLCLFLMTGAIVATGAEIKGGDFTAAKTSYDRGRYAEAYAQFSRLAQETESSAACFNAGNAAYKAGDPGHAVLWYRRAAYLTPRDPDVRANLELAMNAGGAPAMPAPPAWQRWIQRVSATEWGVLAPVSWGVFWVFSAFWIWFGARTAAPFRWAIGVMSVVCMLALAGFAMGQRSARHPEMVVTAQGARALFAPIEGSTVHFIAPPGTVVRKLDTGNGWIKVELDRREGWLPQKSCEQV